MNKTMDGLSINLEQTNLDKLLSPCGEYIEKYRFEWKDKAV